MAFALPGTMSTVISTCPPACRPFMLRHLDLPPLSSRPAPAVISNRPRCHLDLPPLSSRPQGEISSSGQRL